MYASKRRQRNFKRVRECAKPGAPTNPSKRHRERLNGELETVARLLPFDEITLQRLDKLSVLRLAVSFLQIKAHFHVCVNQLRLHGKCVAHPLAITSIMPMGPVPSFFDASTGFSLIDPREPLFCHIALKALSGFLLILNEIGEIYYVSENIDHYLGFLQSDILHQPIFDMIHSEDRDEIRQGLQLNMKRRSNSMAFDSAKDMLLKNDKYAERTIVARFRCLLDNTCGFVRMEIRGRLTELHATTQMNLSHQQHSTPRRYGLLAVCTPFVPPIRADTFNDDPILKTKHALDLTFICSDVRFKQIFEADDIQIISFYDLIHPDDLKHGAEAHTAVIKNGSAGLLIYRMVSRRTNTIVYIQTSLRVFFKNSKPDSIGATHRILTELDGVSLLEKRASMKSKYLTFDDTLLQSPRHLNPSTAQQSFTMKEPVLKPPPLVYKRSSKTANELHAPPLSSFLPDSKAVKLDPNISKLQQMLPTNQDLLPCPSTSALPTSLHQTLPPTSQLFPAPLFPIQLPDQIPAEMNSLGSMFSSYFPTHPMPTDAENLWSNGFKRPLELYSDPFAATACYHSPAQFENTSCSLDYGHQPPAAAWDHEQQIALNSSDFQSTSGYTPRLKFNDLSHSTTLLNGARPDVNLLQSQPAACVDHLGEQSRYYQLPSSFFPSNEQQFGQLDMMPANNFNFLSEVTQTLLGNHCQ